MTDPLIIRILVYILIGLVIVWLDHLDTPTLEGEWPRWASDLGTIVAWPFIVGGAVAMLGVCVVLAAAMLLFRGTEP